MKKHTTLFATAFVLVGLVGAQPAASIMDPGVTPGDALYPADRFKEEVSLAFASAPVIGSPVKTAKLEANIAEERLAEAKALVEDSDGDDSDDIEELLDDYEERMAESIESAEHIEGDELENRLENVSARHTEVIQKIKSEAPSELEEDFEHALSLNAKIEIEVDDSDSDVGFETDDTDGDGEIDFEANVEIDRPENTGPASNVDDSNVSNGDDSDTKTGQDDNSNVNDGTSTQPDYNSNTQTNNDSNTQSNSNSNTQTNNDTNQNTNSGADDDDVVQPSYKVTNAGQLFGDSSGDTKIVLTVTDAAGSDAYINSVKITVPGAELPKIRADYEMYHQPKRSNSYGSEGLASVSVSNNGETVTLQPSTGNQPIEAGDKMKVYIDAKQFGDGETVKTTVNPQTDPAHTYTTG